MVWLIFVLCALVILLAGRKLSHYGDVIAERTGLGGAVIGIVLLSTVTSLPELVTSFSSAVIVGSPDLAVGGLYGANAFNMAIIALLDVLYRKGRLLNRVNVSHILAAGLGTAFVGSTIGLILFYQQGGDVEILGVGLGSLVFLGVYVLSVTLIYRFERKRRAEVVHACVEDEPESCGMRLLYAKTAAVAGVIVAAAIALSMTGDQIAELTGWGRDFVGSNLLAIVTTLPEMVVSIAAMRIGAVDMAVSNLLGSNLFNMVILAVCDLLYPGSLLAAVSPSAVMAGLTSIVMTGIVIVSLMYRTQSDSTARIGGEAASLASVYLIGSYFLFVLSSM